MSSGAVGRCHDGVDGWEAGNVLQLGTGNELGQRHATRGNGDNNRAERAHGGVVKLEVALVGELPKRSFVGGDVHGGLHRV